MKNYYEILEVSENASKEVIDKAYRTLAKKYHPDTQPVENRKMYNEAMKEITEAYNVLTNPILKQKYDLEFKQELYNEVNEEVKKSKNTRVKDKINTNPFVYIGKGFFSSIAGVIYNESKKETKERKKDFKAIGLTIVIIGLLVFIGWKVPFIHDYFLP